MKIHTIVLAMLLCGASGALAHVLKMPDFKDKRDGRVYKTVQIGNQRWFAENLRFNVKGSWCYDNRDYNCETYGRLYDWSMAVRLVDYYNTHSIANIDFTKKDWKTYHDACPAGWRLPANKDWVNLKRYVGRIGKSDGVGLSLKSSELWEKELRLPAGSDEFGFNALPAGLRNEYTGFMDLRSSAQFWSSSEIDNVSSIYWSVMYDSRSFDKVYAAKTDGASIRCIENKVYPFREPPPPPRPKVVPQVVTVQNKIVQTVHIGDQVWMVNNVNVKVPGSYCYDDKEENCERFGRLYTWAAVKESKGVCPNGWHVPTSLDFYRLNIYLKDIDDAVGVGTNLRAREGWLESDLALLGENGFGFSALAGGVRDSVDSTVSYSGIGSFTGFWSASDGDSLRAIAWNLPNDNDDFVMDSSLKTRALPVRCLMNPPDDDEIYDSTSIHDKRDDNKYKTLAVGEDIWMAENLRFAAPGSFCYEDKDIRCRNYGRLYPWYVAMRLPEDFIENSLDSVSQGAVIAEHQGICPEGWHIPRQEEWMRLGQFAINKRKGLAAALKSREGWAQGSLTKNNNASGFNALAAGARFSSDGEFAELGSSAYFWAAEGGGGMGAAYWHVVSSKDDFNNEEDFDGNAYSLRCVKNKVPPKEAAPENNAAVQPSAATEVQPQQQ